MKAKEFEQQVAKSDADEYFNSVKEELRRMTQYVEESEANFNKAHDDGSKTTDPVDFLTFCVSRVKQFDTHADQAVRAVVAYTKAN